MNLDWPSFWLPVVVGLPLAAALGLAALALLMAFLGLPALPPRAWRAAGLGAAMLNFGLSCAGAALTFDAERIGFQSVQRFGWSEALGAELILGVDGISLCFLLSTAALVPISMLAAGRSSAGFVRSWVFVSLLLESSLLGAIVSIHFLSFVFFWALALLPILFWLGRWGGEGRARAASRLWATESVALACLLFVAFILREVSAEALGGVPSLALVAGEDGPGLLDVPLMQADERMLLAAMLVAIGVRMPLAPLHFWLPAAQSAAPLGLSMLVATGFAQTAAIGLLHFALPLFPNAVAEAGPLLAWLGIGALAYASLVALVQKELKRLIAFASIGYAGFAFFGVSTLNSQGLTGAVLQLLSHGFATAGLFLLIGFLAARRQTTEVAAFGGLAKPMPVCAFFFGLMAFSLMGMPLFGGFVGDLFVLLGSLESRRRLSLIALVAMIVSASYLLWLQRRIFLGPVEQPENRGLIDLDRLERSLLLALSIPILGIGIYPNPVLRRVEPAVLEILFQMELRSVAPSDSPADSPEDSPPPVTLPEAETELTHLGAVSKAASGSVR